MKTDSNNEKFKDGVRVICAKCKNPVNGAIICDDCTEKAQQSFLKKEAETDFFPIEPSRF